MSDNIIYLNLQGYLRQWCEHQFGKPAQFPARSVENEIIRRYLSVRPANVPAVPENVAELFPVCAPAMRHRPWERYNYLTKEGRYWLLTTIRNLFTLDMMESLLPALGKPFLLNALREWCRTRGITADHDDAIVKCFYRTRCSYEQQGLLIRKRYVRRKKISVLQ